MGEAEGERGERETSLFLWGKVWGRLRIEGVVKLWGEGEGSEKLGEGVSECGGTRAGGERETSLLLWAKCEGGGRRAWGEGDLSFIGGKVWGGKKLNFGTKKERVNRS